MARSSLIPTFSTLAILGVAIVGGLARQSHAQWAELGNFESASIGLLDGQEGWTTIGTEATYEVVVDPEDSGNQVLKATGWTGPGAGVQANAYLSLGSETIPDGTTGTIFFRMRNTGINLDNNGGDFVFGASDVAAPATWQDYEGYMVMREGMFQLRDATTNTNVGDYNSDEWYNIWLVLDHTADTSTLYASQGSDPAAQVGTLSGAFRTTNNDVHDDLVSLNVRMGTLHNTNMAEGFLDDIYVDTSGSNLILPEGVGTPGSAGDFDLDNDVDGADFLKWQQDGLSATDLEDWQNNYPIVGGLVAIAVPEPTAGWLALLGFSALVSSRRGRSE